MTSESDTLARLVAYHDHIDTPPVPIEDDVRRGRRRVRRNRGLVAGGVGLAVATVVATSLLLSGEDQVQKPQPITPSPPPTKTASPEPVVPDAVRDGTSWPRVKPQQTELGSQLGMGDVAMAWVDDAGDVDVDLVDIRLVGSTSDGQEVTGDWRMTLAKAWPGRSKIGPADGVVEYGVVVDSDGDRVADCHIGINDDTRQVHSYGDYRVWVTNLRSGVTREQVGGPYGFPIDFALPDETGTWVGFFFLTQGQQPCHFRGPVRYYMYASAIDRDGHVIARDFAPDAAWLQGTPDDM